LFLTGYSFSIEEGQNHFQWRQEEYLAPVVAAPRLLFLFIRHQNDLSCNLLTRSVLTWSASPAESTRTTSPGWRFSSKYCVTSGNVWIYRAERCGMALTISADVKSCLGSRAAYTSVTITRSASRKARVNSRKSVRVREYVCGCQTAQIRAWGNRARAPARVARISVGW